MNQKPVGKIQLTVAGAFNYEKLIPGEQVVLFKEPTNRYDDEAIRIDIVRNGKIEPRGYVANSYKTRRKGTVSGSRIYDRLDERSLGIVINEDTIEIEVHD